MLTDLSAKQPKVYHIYFLGGQSNMDGIGNISELSDELIEPFNEIYIFHGNSTPDGAQAAGRGIWSPLQPGHGFGFSSDGEHNYLSDTFGLELSFAARMQTLQPDVNLALIKYSRAGTSIDPEASGGFGCWLPDDSTNQFDHFIATITKALSQRDIDNDGIDEILIPAGIIWMQGESDAAYTKEIATRYAGNLKFLLTEIRRNLGQPRLPVAIGQITDSGQDEDGKVWNFGDIVRRAQKEVAESDPTIELVTATDMLSCADGVHYDSPSLIKLGDLFAETINSMQPKK